MLKLEDMCIISLDKGEKKVKCKIFYNKELKRKLAIHEDIDCKDVTSVSDVITGFRLFKLNTKVENIKMEQVQERLDVFIKHYTLTEIEKRFRILEEVKK